MLRFYNTLTREKQEFVSIEKDVVKIYSCGPTVYNYQQIGNLRAAIFVDVLKRILRYFKYEVIDVVNITDVGHLVSDEDEGEDKMLKAAKREDKDPYEIARYYENIYVEELKLLNVILPKYMPRATDHIKEQIKMISDLEKGGYTYATDDGVYFDVTKFKKYGRLSKQKLSQKKSGARVEIDSQKRHSHDFALWKFLTKENKNHIMKWDTPWGTGFPGWHLECSAMSAKYLGEEFDIHTGGIDHIPVHHENEIAQNECSGAVKRVNYWMHNAFLKVDGQKMSKSLGNVYILSDLVGKGYNPLALRELCLRTHYRKTLNFTFDSLEAGEVNVKRINEFYVKLKEMKANDVPSLKEEIFYKYLDEFENAITDDLNMPVALSAVFEFMNKVNKQSLLSEKDIKRSIGFMERTDKVLGLLDFNFSPFDEKVLELARERQHARQLKDFAKADELRDEIKELGYEVKDSRTSKEGFYLEKIQ